MLEDDANRLYFVFLCPIVQEFERINAFFQLKNAEPEELLKELDLHHESLKRLYSSDGKMLSLEDVDFGAHFTNEMKKYQESHENSLRVSLDLKRRCYDFLMKLLDEVKMRLPNNKSEECVGWPLKQFYHKQIVWCSQNFPCNILWEIKTTSKINTEK
ncbi:hypothetical protein AVEN_176282-1 [Araneus ventricosus]|uniref:Uncharacterized protein n=1 Tax=Araneus ventricosus TaxID=182803 RepID=A0A4Y2N5V0_ARAVE|nr:hypothetical protein AVEN_176282-1 [Araneus ventricosus]